ncbi:chondramide synthase cmdD [Desulfosporosinus acididurans]|uniref:Chondramide synthase cmdD n=1 Tax=Desulfosporosinus acididurans TaxID=476652 RepID=A0A0J1FJV5_9FIRM|nr:PEP/pyruvate-binding domain-containing protein [Desulfosporosinus acididurans]KLU63725.1 chondramide synthase cmdD [Desulfosporosinus acididurans]
MGNFVQPFKELAPEFYSVAGGKGGMLARMYQSGYPVPEGFVILPSAFHEQGLNDKAWHEIQAYLSDIVKNYEGVAFFAVRSSALSEDSASASFAGEFETVLNVEADKVSDAVYTVFMSTQSERVKVYSSVHGFDKAHEIAVVVQLMVQSEISGVIFTADPITGSHTCMMGNYVYGLGEQLVSGEVNANPFKLIRPKGKYDGPSEFKQYASELFRYAINLEKEYNGPQDIEWAVVKGKVYLLQSRPVTSLRTINYDSYEINDSCDGDFLWTNNNVGEAIPDVMTPFTWSLIRELDLECQKVTGYYLWSGNIYGRVYTNVSMLLSIMPQFGISLNWGKKLIGDVFGKIPDNVEVPIYPFEKIALLKELVQRGKKNVKRIKEAQKHKEYYLNYTQQWCTEIIKQIGDSNSGSQLLELWLNEIRPYVSKLWNMWLGGASSTTLMTFRKRLIKLVGEEEANLLLSDFRGDNGLESLGPLIGIMKISKGELSREDYMAKYGHRSPHEFEASIPYPIEDEEYLDKQLTEYRKSGVDVEELLQKQQVQFEQAKERFRLRYPAKRKWLEQNISKLRQAAQLRESLRSEFVKTFRVIRSFMLKLSELTQIGNDVFFLYCFEVPDLLRGDNSMLRHLAVRKQNYERYQTLPVMPQFIRGRFDPFEWAKDVDRRLDYYGPQAENLPRDGDIKVIKGFAGAAGKIEGNVRVLESFAETESFLPGEILVTSTTNVGWTPLFPKTAAIITDIGAPLSHAAIVARELGIPAVVGCGTATRRLKTGDRVIVDGGQGLVEILNQN